MECLNANIEIYSTWEQAAERRDYLGILGYSTILRREGVEWILEWI